MHQQLNMLDKYAGLYRSMRPPVFCWSDAKLAAKVILGSEDEHGTAALFDKRPDDRTGVEQQIAESLKALGQLND